MSVALDDLVQHAAFELAGMHPVDQQAALAAACESLAESLREQRPWLSDAEIRKACTELAKRVRARLAEIEPQAAGHTVH